ncbi:Tn3 family transposase [Actinomadura terrae]|uniref:Tn3 family transposase n=1 Tax=Actinomadura terrae TaxID=604353 RepID=UPI003557B39F
MRRCCRRSDAGSHPRRPLAVVAWTNEYYSRAVLELRAQGRDVLDDLLSHVSPGRSDHINLFGTIDVDIDAELDNGWRPLRPTQLNAPGLSFLISP